MRAGGAELEHRVALPAPLRLAERLRGDARSRRRHVPARAGGRGGARRAPLPARHQRSGDELGHQQRLDHRARRAADRAVAPRARALPHPPARADRLRRRPRARATDPLRQRRGAGDARLRAALRLRALAGNVGVHRQHLPRGRLPRRARRGVRADAHLRHEHGLRGPARYRPDADEGGRHDLRCPVLVRAPGAEHLRGGLRPARLDGAPLAALARPRHVPRPPMAHGAAAVGADPERALLRADRGTGRRRHHVAARVAGRRAQLGLPLHVDQGRHVHAVGPLHARLRLGGQRLLLLHRRRGRVRAEHAPDHVRDRRGGHARGAHARPPGRLRGRAARADRQRRVQAGPARRLGSAARLGLPPHEVARPPARADLADPQAPGRGGAGELARARSRHLGDPRRASALHVVEADVLGGGGSRRPAGRDPGGARVRGSLAVGRGRDQERHPGERGRRARRVVPALRHGGPGRLGAADRDDALPADGRRAACGAPCWRSRTS